MTFTPGFNGVNTNDTTPVTLVPAPAERTQRIISKMILCNVDNATRRIKAKHVTAGGSSFLIFDGTIKSNAAGIIHNIILAGPAQSITIELTASVSATQWDCTAFFGDLGP